MNRSYLYRLGSFVLAFFSLSFSTALDFVLRHLRPQFDAHTHMSLDRASRTVNLTHPAITRARAFVERCLKHDLFSGLRFDPGRMPA